MPTVSFGDSEIDCEEGAVLRDVLLDSGVSPHNGTADTLNCRGHGTCGTCAVEIRSEAADTADPPVSAVGTVERGRLSIPPHDSGSGLRLACQTRVYADIEVTKHPGFWGHRVGEE
ncbi:2Fe-2S iron-sulfur cluster-binding protein [Halobellus ruber]|uniref:2Fe-2S iron-sulfur cluster binding domain-containing protein n=1 Tax=Halobellus ruber TaxID=2761102 RepID=A0A7J9SKC2_9EURY|nr:2Fe-2S iron-sulfur cluster binding domain-containing protein [Halobellus ruber]MBB6646833.1 2Fe-2S iron-sulfur cluster binding domain-containing protein [Halobellus ruber]